MNDGGGASWIRVESHVAGRIAGEAVMKSKKTGRCGVCSGLALLMIGATAAAWASTHLKVDVVPLFKSTDCTAGVRQPELRYFGTHASARAWLRQQLGHPVRAVVLPQGLHLIGLSGGVHPTTGYGIQVADDAVMVGDGLLLLPTRWVVPGQPDDLLALPTATCLLLGVPAGATQHIRVLDQHGRVRLQVTAAPPVTKAEPTRAGPGGGATTLAR